jgi:hypothetical protein
MLSVPKRKMETSSLRFAFGISAAGSRCAYARSTPQLRARSKALWMTKSTSNPDFYFRELTG